MGEVYRDIAHRGHPLTKPGMRKATELLPTMQAQDVVRAHNAILRYFTAAFCYFRASFGPNMRAVKCGIIIMGPGGGWQEAKQGDKKGRDADC